MESLVQTRRKLPDTRHSIDHEFRIGELDGVIIVGLFPDKTPGEIFVEMQKDATALGALVDSWAIMVSMSLQYGTPLDVIVKKFAYARFSPDGATRHPKIQFATSILDYVARWLGYTFIPDYHGQST